jgi:hypothetical protein
MTYLVDPEFCPKCLGTLERPYSGETGIGVLFCPDCGWEVPDLDGEGIVELASWKRRKDDGRK